MLIRIKTSSCFVNYILHFSKTVMMHVSSISTHMEIF